jgi:hypothetical protein
MAIDREALIAPCGLDCSLCYRYQRSKDEFLRFIPCSDINLF